MSKSKFVYGETSVGLVNIEVNARVSISNFKNDIKESTPEYRIENCSSGHLLIFGGYNIVIWVNTILNPIDTRAILPRYGGSSRTKISSRHPYPTGSKRRRYQTNTGENPQGLTKILLLQSRVVITQKHELTFCFLMKTHKDLQSCQCMQSRVIIT